MNSIYSQKLYTDSMEAQEMLLLLYHDQYRYEKHMHLVRVNVIDAVNEK